MGRLFMIAAVITAFAASWVSAGNFDVLADSGGSKPPTWMKSPAGQVVKTEYKASLKTTSDEELDLEADKLLSPPVVTKQPSIKPKPTLAYKERPKGMAPPEATAPKLTDSLAAGAKTESVELDADLEKDLVISPPPAKADDQIEPKPMVEKKPVDKSVVAGKKAERKKAAPRVQKVTPRGLDAYAQGPRVIQKVKPVSQNPWQTAAGNYAAPNRPERHGVRIGNTESRKRVPVPNYAAMDPYANQEETNYGYAPPVGRAIPNDRIVRDGVTIKLTPASAPQLAAECREDSSESDLLGAATEIIGLPFALISAFF